MFENLSPDHTAILRVHEKTGIAIWFDRVLTDDEAAMLRKEIGETVNEYISIRRAGALFAKILKSPKTNT